jgi:copper chaperone
MEKIQFDVKGMACGHCKAAVEKALLGIDGVEAADADLENGKADVEYDPAKTTVSAMKKAVVDAGYEA